MDNKNAFESLTTATDYILPSMEFLTTPNATPRDSEVAEKIRNRWCSMLGINIASKQSMKLFLLSLTFFYPDVIIISLVSLFMSVGRIKVNYACEIELLLISWRNITCMRAMSNFVLKQNVLC